MYFEIRIKIVYKPDLETLKTIRFQPFFRRNICDDLHNKSIDPVLVAWQ